MSNFETNPQAEQVLLDEATRYLLSCQPKLLEAEKAYADFLNLYPIGSRIGYQGFLRGEFTTQGLCTLITTYLWYALDKKFDGKLFSCPVEANFSGPIPYHTWLRIGKNPEIQRFADGGYKQHDPNHPGMAIDLVSKEKVYYPRMRTEPKDISLETAKRYEEIALDHLHPPSRPSGYQRVRLGMLEALLLR